MYIDSLNMKRAVCLRALLNTNAYNSTNDDFINISFVPKWFIENNLNTDVQINANDTAKR